MPDVFTLAGDLAIEYLTWYTECEHIPTRIILIPVSVVAYLIVLIADIADDIQGE